MTKQDRCAVWLNRISAPMFWFTVLGEFYYGFKYVHPVVYDNSEYWMYVNRCVCYFLCFEFMINWLCIRFVKSTWSADDFKNHLEDAKHEMSVNAVTLDIDILRREKPGSYTMGENEIENKSEIRHRRKGPLHVVSMTPTEDGRRLALAYPYWSWKSCDICHKPRPPRVHHCPLCQSCVLKRDHHCYFAGACVGLRNQRHFIVFNFWAQMVILYSLVHISIYCYKDYCRRNTVFDVFLPFAFWRYVFGYVSFLDLGFITVSTAIVVFFVATAGFLHEQFYCVRGNMTSYERDNAIKVASESTLEQNITDVFGDYPLLNILLPLHWLFPTPEDGITWSHIKL